jgi:CheY-like chemotaxis protein
MCRELVARVLREAGCEVILAKDGFQAITELYRWGQRLVLLIVDTEMPGVHGWEVMRCARDRTRSTGILRLGRPEDEPPGPGYRLLRGIPVLSKPFTQADLAAILRTHFGWLRMPRKGTRPRRRR